MSAKLTVNFEDADAAEANVLCGELQDSLRQDVPEADVSRVKPDPLTQDFGATLVVILGTTAVTAVAKGIAAWLAARHEAKLRLTRTNSDGSTEEIVVDGQLGARAQQVVTEFLTNGSRGG